MKKSISKLLSILMVSAMLAASFAGCSNPEQAPAASGTGQSTTAPTESTPAAEDEEMKEIEVTMLSFAPLDDEKTKAVVEAINAVSEKEINVHANIKWYDPNTYSTQVPMMLQANEKLDIIHYTPVPGSGFSSFQTQNQLLDISKYIDTYAPNIKSTLGNLLDATSVGDGVYGVASYRLLSSDLYIFMRKDMLEELGMVDKARNIKSWSEFEEILAAVKAKFPDVSPIVNADAQGTITTIQPFNVGADSFAENFFYDELGDSMHMTYAEDDGIVKCYFFEDSYKQSLDRVRGWYNKGYVYKDAATTQDLGQVLMKNGVGFSYLQGSEVGAEKTMSANTNRELVAVNLVPGMISTGACQKFGLAVPVTSTEPEAAVKFLNLMYTNETIANTLAWGVEGRDWVANGDALAKYPDGVTGETVTYHTADFLYGNQFITRNWGDDAQMRIDQKAALDGAKVSKFTGFTVNSALVENEVTACFNVTKEFKASLGSGSADVDKIYAEFCDKLKAAGMETILKEYQKQLDEWVKLQG